MRAQAHYPIAALLTFAACTEQSREPPERVSSALGVVPATETAQWKRVGSATLPDGRYGQASALDEARGVLVMFGGVTGTTGTPLTAKQDIWEWDPTLGAWKARTIAGSTPEARLHRRVRIVQPAEQGRNL